MPKKKPPAPYLAEGPQELNWQALDEYLAQPAQTEAAPEPEGSGFMRRAGDVGISLMKGAIAVPEAAVGLADMATGGRVGKALENEGGTFGFRPREAREMLDQYYSPEQKQAFSNVQQADGVVDTAVQALKNPSVIGHSIVESLPLMGGGGVIGRALLRAAPKMGAVTAGAAGEGVMAAGSGAEQIRQETPGGLLSGTQAGIAAGSGLATGALGAIGGVIARRLGVTDVDTLLAGKAAPEVEKGFIRRVLEGAVAEGVLEELPQSAQEQVAQNAALGRPLDEGLDKAIVLGTLAGMGMGGGMQVFSRSPGDQIRQDKLPEDGPLSRAVNAGVEQAAKQVEASILPDHEQIQPPQEEGVLDPLGPGESVSLDPGSGLVRPDRVAAEVQPELLAHDPLSAGVATGLVEPGPIGATAVAPDAATAPAVEPLVALPYGGPFKNRRAALAKQREVGGEIVQVEGGWAVRRTPDAQPDAAGTGEAGPAVAGRGDGSGVLYDQRPGRAEGAEQAAVRPAGGGDVPAGVEPGGAPDALKVGQAVEWGGKSWRVDVAGRDSVRIADERGKKRLIVRDTPAWNALRPVQADPVAGEKIDSEWTAFAPESGTKAVPRAEMPQIRAEHHGPLVNFLTARGIAHEQTEVDPATLKPTQAEFSPAKVKTALEFTGSDRSVLVSSDGYVLDGHHRWLAKREAGQPVKVIRWDAPIDALMAAAKEFPSASVADGATDAAAPAPTTLSESGPGRLDTPQAAAPGNAGAKAVADAPAIEEKVAPPAPAPTPEAAKPARDEELIQRRKRLAVLRSLRECLA